MVLEIITQQFQRDRFRLIRVLFKDYLIFLITSASISWKLFYNAGFDKLMAMKHYQPWQTLISRTKDFVIISNREFITLYNVPNTFKIDLGHV